MLSDRVAFITGASRGIGRAIALTLSKAGTDIAGIDLNLDELKSAMKMIEDATGRKAIAVQADVADPASVEKGGEEAIAVFGRSDILVKNAGITRDNILLRI